MMSKTSGMHIVWLYGCVEIGSWQALTAAVHISITCAANPIGG
jgi:hypothetical protein